MGRVLTQRTARPEKLLDEIEGFETLPEPEDVEIVEHRHCPRWTALGQVDLEWIDAAGERQLVQAEMRDRSVHGLGVISPRRFPVGETVFVTFPKGEERSAVVRHLQSSTDGWRIGLCIIVHERRRFERCPVDGIAQLQWGDDKQGRRTSLVGVKNISTEGMQLRTLEAVRPGTVVKVTGDSVQCIGKTCYCQPDGKAFLVGIHMTCLPHQPNGLHFRP